MSKRTGKYTEVSQVIDDLIKAFQRAGVQIPDDVRRNVQEQLRAAYGGTEVYVPRLPRENKSRIQEFGTSVPATYVARKLGLHVKYVRRVRSLLKPK